MLESLANAFASEGIAIYWGIGLIFFAAEYWWPARPVSYLQVLLPDVAALTTYQVFFVFAAQLTDRIPFPHYSYWRWQAFPSVSNWWCSCWSSMESPIGCIDFGIRRGAGRSIDGTMRRRSCTGWPVSGRVFHKSSSLMSLYLLAFPLLKLVPSLFFPLYSYMLVLTNNWMHMNVTWQSRKLE
ncbi:MAG: hypothetical protein OJF50_003576 [Nitrospira sp.]|jgi:hypothetical protein|nr:hypothetical protein [Nitrospira sp.]